MWYPFQNPVTTCTVRLNYVYSSAPLTNLTFLSSVLYPSSMLPPNHTGSIWLRRKARTPGESLVFLCHSSLPSPCAFQPATLSQGTEEWRPNVTGIFHAGSEGASSRLLGRCVGEGECKYLQKELWILQSQFGFHFSLENCFKACAGWGAYFPE